jgi:signal transduction histidine kinase
VYARIGLQADAPPLTCGYVEPVEPINTRLTGLSRWFRELNPWALDIVIGTAFTALGLISLFTTADPRHHFEDPGAVAAVLALGCSVPYYFRRRAPLAVLLVSLAALVLLATHDYQSGAQSQMIVVGAYSVGSHSSGRKRLVGLAGIGVAVGVVARVGIPEASGANLALSGAIYLASYLFGSTVRNRRLYMEQLEARAAALEHEKEEEARRAVADERLRIAQELHDVVAHSMGVIAVQAGVGAHVIDKDPAEAKKSLDAIGKTSRATLTEIRRLLGVLRADENGAYQPAPGLDDLERLAADLDAAGVPVTLTIDGPRGDVPPGVDLTAYRIVQEALTNVLKHAGTARATVLVGYQPGAVHLEVTDDGRGVNGRATEGGHGLMGMRERVGVYGGTLVAGPAPGGGFRVVAELPYRDAE